MCHNNEMGTPLYEDADVDVLVEVVYMMVPKTLAENAGLNAMEIISSLYAEHASGNTKVGLDLEEGRCKDVSTLNICDLHITNEATYPLRKVLSSQVCCRCCLHCCTVDQIIMENQQVALV
ncbi:DNA glycosylase superfamily protein [Prunus dulcis]|uniref:DNA glycosylase superfamily protein n=1 Tax=Prunus dulcis TaxID=3755 RepID=A0A4Y1R605_PRUDU|nr:DNA glycosylase superfamily protein [Prunus dulcis]